MYGPGKRGTIVRAVGTLWSIAIAIACSGNERSFDSAVGGGGNKATDSNPSTVAAGGTTSVDGLDPGAGGSSGGVLPGGGGSAGAAGVAGNEDPCAPNPCQNGATCSEDGDEYSCECVPGFEGAQCEINIDECAGSPCQNAGTCEDGIANYTCRCPGAFTGHDCELPRFEILPPGMAAHDVSSDGTAVVGSATVGQTERAARYDSAGFHDLGVYFGDTHSVAAAASTGAAVVVGHSYHWVSEAPGRISHALRWDGANMQDLSRPAGAKECEATDVTPDGSVIVGTCDRKVVRWRNGVREDLGTPPNVEGCNDAFVNNDGSVLFGWCFVYPILRTFRHTAETGFTLLTNAPNRSSCLVVDVDAAGVNGGGYCVLGGSATEAIAWSATEGMRFIGAGTAIENVKGVSDDGRILVGDNSNVASLWEAGVPRPVKDLLPLSVSERAAEWNLDEALAVSADGKVVIGRASRPDDYQSRAFIARLE